VTSFDGYDDPEEFVETARHARRDIETDLRELVELVENAKQMPLSNSALIPREEVLGLLEQALTSLPEEVREARWALRDREELMAAEVQKAQQLMDQVRAEAARMVDKTEIVRQAQARAMINQSEDFIDGKLGNFEIVLERLLKTARSGRERLSAQGLPTSMIEPAPIAIDDTLYEPGYAPPTSDESSFFDQDAF